MASLKSDKEAIALAHLALQFDSPQGNNIVGSAPTDEELTSLYEGQLDATRRAQVMSHIANNSEVHQRWIRCVDSLSYIDELETKTSEKIKLHQGLFAFISNLFHKKMLLGSGFSTAAVIIFVIAVQSQSPDFDIQLKLNDAYSNWGGTLQQEWTTLADDQKPKPVFSSDRSYFSEAKEKSTIQQILETGFKMAINQIGHVPFKDYGITVDKLSDTKKLDFANKLSPSQYDSLLQIGQISALAAVQCKLDSASKRLLQLNAALVKLKEQLDDLALDGVKTLNDKMVANNNACVTAQYVVDLITN